MVEIIEVTTKRQLMDFIKYPLKLYKGCKYFVPFFNADEYKLLKPGSPLLKDCDAKLYLAYRDGKIVGRTGAAVQFKYNAINNYKRARFFRYDSIDDAEVAKALLTKVEEFARERGMNEVHGPYGLSETDRAAYLVEGFDIIANLGTNYNYPYYDSLFTACGYVKNGDWRELIIRPDPANLERLEKISNFSLKRNGLKIHKFKNVKDLLENYGWKMFDCMNKAYKHLPGYVPFEYEQYELTRDQFKLLINIDFTSFITNEAGDLAGFCICFPTLSEEIRDSRGRMGPITILKLLHRIKHPKTLDLALIGVDPAYANSGVNAAIMVNVLRSAMRYGCTQAEAYPEFEENEQINAQWKTFNAEYTKRRRVVIKKLDEIQS